MEIRALGHYRPRAFPFSSISFSLSPKSYVSNTAIAIGREIHDIIVLHTYPSTLLHSLRQKGGVG